MEPAMRHKTIFLVGLLGLLFPLLFQAQAWELSDKDLKEDGCYPLEKMDPLSKKDIHRNWLKLRQVDAPRIYRPTVRPIVPGSPKTIPLKDPNYEKHQALITQAIYEDTTVHGIVSISLPSQWVLMFDDADVKADPKVLEKKRPQPYRLQLNLHKPEYDLVLSYDEKGVLLNALVSTVILPCDNVEIGPCRSAFREYQPEKGLLILKKLSLGYASDVYYDYSPTGEFQGVFGGCGPCYSR
jgi:hypothetical protein